MKLHASPPSPFVRKVMVMAIETGLDDRIEPVFHALSPVAPVKALNRDNPVGKIPCLVMDDGEALYDSRVICEYLDSLHDGPKMFPADGAARWTALRRQALADGLMDAAVLRRYETVLRPEELRWEEWNRNQGLKVQRCVDALETEVEGFGKTLDIGSLSVGVALSYLDFRFPKMRWAATHPKLANWHPVFTMRDSMTRTEPPAG